MRAFISSILSAIVSLFLVQSLQAASSEWQDLGGGKARLLAVLDPDTRQIEAAVEVKLKPGWTTYWRYPGSSGIPPRFNFSNSRGFLVEEIGFPAPSLLGQNGLTYAGYKNSVTFPIKGLLDTTQPAILDLQLLIGVCASVCIPAQASFSLEITDLLRSDPLATQIITSAKNRVPRIEEPGNLNFEKAMSGDKQLLISVTYAQENGNPALFVEGPQDWYLTPARLLNVQNGAAQFSLDISRVPDGTDVMMTRLTYTLSAKGAGIEFHD